MVRIFGIILFAEVIISSIVVSMDQVLECIKYILAGNDNGFEDFRTELIKIVEDLLSRRYAFVFILFATQ